MGSFKIFLFFLSNLTFAFSNKQTEFPLKTWTWVCNQLEINNWSEEDVKKNTPPKQVEYLSLLNSNVELVSGYTIFCQLSIDHDMNVQFQLKTNWMPWQAIWYYAMVRFGTILT